MKLIPLTKGQFAKVDDDDFERLSKFKWYATWHPNTKSFYAARTVSLHREISGEPLGKKVDHVNRDTLDCQKQNLRVCTNSENGRNRGLNSNSTSGFRGVHWHKKSKKWIASICVGIERKHLGSFSDKTAAADAYRIANKKYFGAFGGIK